MSIASVTNNPLLNALSTQTPSTPSAETGEATRNGRDVSNDGDNDDRRAAAASAQQTPAPTVNTSGQVTGQHINVQA